MHALLPLVGIIILVAGLGFMGQGFRFFSFSANSFTVGHKNGSITVQAWL